MSPTSGVRDGAEENGGLFDTDRGTQSPTIKIAAAVCALLLSVGLLAGYAILRQRYMKSAAEASQDKRLQEEDGAPAEAQIYEDEALLRGTQAILGGTVHNITEQKLEGLMVELELRRRGSKEMVSRLVEVTPRDLSPGEQGRYTLSLPSREWSGARLLHLRSSGERQRDIAFKSAPGARRPPERPPAGKTTIVVVPRPKPKGDDFINTPDNPEVIR